MIYSNLFESVEDVWLVWLIGVTGLVTMTYRALQVPQWKSLQRFMSDERGASYAIPYVMTFPVYLIFVCWTIQSSMILMTKFGTAQAAHMAARTAIVWRSANQDNQQQGWRTAQEKAQHAAALSLTPVASGYERFQVLYAFYPGALGRSLNAIPEALAYERLYREFASQTEAGNDLAEEAFVRQKYMYAAAMTTVELSETANRFNADLTAEVNYRMPLHVPLTGRLLGQLDFSRRAFYRDIPASAVLPLETPESVDLRLGIAYDPQEAN